MIVLKSISLKNIIYYKEAYFDLDYEGISVIYGKNLNVINNQSNACGKSLLVSALSDVIQNTVPVGSGTKRGIPKDMFSRPDSSIVLELKKDKSYVLNKFLKGKKIQYNISEDGNNTEIRTPSLALEELNSIFPISEQAYFTLYHLDSRRPFELQMGTASVRHSFFSSLFSLDDYDRIKEYCDTRIKDLKEDKIKQETLIDEAARIKKSLVDTDTDALKSLCKEITKKLKAAKKEFSDIVLEVNNIKLVKSHEKSLRFIREFKRKGIKNAKHAKKKVKEIRADLAIIKEHDSYLREVDSYEKNSSRIDTSIELYSKRLKKLGTLDKNKLDVKLDRMKKINDDVEAKKRSLTKLKERATGVKKPRNSVKHISKEIAVCELHSDNAENKKIKILIKKKHETTKLDNLKKHIKNNSSECGTCGSKLNKEIANELMETSVELIDIYSKKVSKYSDLINNDNSKVEQLAKELVKAETYLEQQEILKQISELEKDIDNIDCDYYHMYSSASKYFAALESKSNLSVPEFNLELPKKKPSEKKLADLIKFLSCLDSTAQAYIIQEENGIELSTIDDDLANSNIKYKKLQEKVSKLQERLPNINAEITIYNRDKDNLARLNKQIKSLNALLKDLPIYKLLYSAYSSKGIKALVMQTIANSISSNMNKYSSLLFSEHMEFSIKIEPGIFEIIATRGKKNPLSSDVRTLSGSESRCFNMLIAISILPLIPANNRLNIMVLDEMTANLSQASKDNFINNFLPVLKMIIPHIIVVTPDGDIYPNAREYVAQKSKSVTSLVKKF